MENLLKDFYSINSNEQLRERGLSLSDYKTLQVVVKELSTTGESSFFQTSIAKYLRKFDIKFVNKHAILLTVVAQ